jgi:very-short-patch-repair endonuclease
MAKLPKPLNEAEETFDLHCKTQNLCPKREFEFCPGRKWRFDFAWPKIRLAVEIEGGVHRIKDRYQRDVEKYNTATLMEWRILRFTPQMVKSGRALEVTQNMMIISGGNPL